MRIDVFVWRARFFRTRGAATTMIAHSGVRIERGGLVRRTDKPSALVEAGDIIAFTGPSGPKLVRIVSLPDRRGPPAEAALCYQPLGGGGPMSPA